MGYSISTTVAGEDLGREPIEEFIRDKKPVTLARASLIVMQLAHRAMQQYSTTEVEYKLLDQKGAPVPIGIIASKAAEYQRQRSN